MALGPGISFIDWVSLSGQNTADTIIDFTLLTGTEVIDINNLRTPRLRQISRITPVTNGVSDRTTKYQIDMSTMSLNYNEHNYQEYMEIGCIAFLACNTTICSACDVTVELYNALDVLVATETINFPFVVGRRTQDMYFVLSQIYSSIKKVKVELVQSSPAGPTLDFGRLWIGNYMEVDFDSDYGFSYGSGAKESLSSGNDSYLNYKTPRKEMDFNFSFIDESDVYNTDVSCEAFSKYVSTNRDLVVLPNVTNGDVHNESAIYGKLKKPVLISHNKGSLFDSSIDVIQLVWSSNPLLKET